jgi:hypothetical protein
MLAGTGALIALPLNTAAIGLYLDLERFGLLGAIGDQRRLTLGADLLVGRQRVSLFADGQMAVIAAFGPGPIRLLTAATGWRWAFEFFAVEMIAAVFGRGLFAASAEELTAELAHLGTELFVVGFEPLFAFQGAGVLSFPVADLLPKFGDLAA